MQRPRGKLLTIGILACLGLVLKIVAFVGPEWAGVHVPVKEDPVFWDDAIKDGNPIGGPCDDGSKPIFEDPNGNTPGPRLPPCPKLMIDPMPEAYRKEKRHCGPGVKISLGLWYTVTCSKVSRPDDDDDDDHVEKTTSEVWMPDRKKRSHHEHKEIHDREGHDFERECHVSTYPHADEVADNLPTELQSLSDIVKNIAKYTNKVLCEFRVESTVGIATSFMGVIALLVYVMGGARSRWSAITSFISLLTSGVVFLVAVGKVASILVMAHKFLESDSGMSDLNVHFSVPWCPIVATVGAILTLAATFGMLLVLSRGHDLKDMARPYEVKGENYERFVNQDAGPLPTKVKF